METKEPKLKWHTEKRKILKNYDWAGKKRTIKQILF